MSTAVGCFEDVFGLSRTGCDCFTSDMPSGADPSQSGLFLDETPGLNLTRIFAGQGCDDTGWEILEKAKVHGVQAFRDRVLSQVRVSTKWKRQPVRAQIGDTKGGTGTVTLPKTYHGLELVLADHVGGTATIKRIGAYVKFTGSIDVNVYEELLRPARDPRSGRARGGSDGQAGAPGGACQGNDPSLFSAAGGDQPV